MSLLELAQLLDGLQCHTRRDPPGHHARELHRGAAVGLAPGYLQKEINRLRFEPTPVDQGATVIPISAAATGSAPSGTDQPVHLWRAALRTYLVTLERKTAR